jgi:hypothetical protein
MLLMAMHTSVPMSGENVDVLIAERRGESAA